MEPRILILSASTGGGHMRASSALKSYITDNYENAVVDIVDTLAYINPILNKTVTEGYVQMVRKTPNLFGAVYNSSNKETPLNSFVVSFNNFFSKKLLPLIEEFKPNIIITTHPFSTEMISNLKEQKLIDIPLVCILTDYAPHRTWINKHVNEYIVANEDMIDLMVEMGAKRESIHPFGIPIDPSFYTKHDKDLILRELGLNPKIPTILVMAGSFGVSDIMKIYKNIVNIDLDFQLIIITGRNQKLYDAFDKIISDQNEEEQQNKYLREIKKIKDAIIKPIKNKPTKLLFFTNEVEKYMHASDLIITKPGGLTVSEALGCNLPMAIFNAIPGQEEENADFLINNDMAVKISKGPECANIIEELLSDSSKLGHMKTCCENFDKSKSSENILKLIEAIIN